MRARTAEPMVMDDAASIDAFDAVDPILQAPIYRLCALAMSALLPAGGTVLDLGSGTGRLLAELARGRPDARAIGLELSAGMIEAGRTALAREGLDGRVQLRQADMTRPEAAVREPVALVSCVWALHHLPEREDALRCLRAIAAMRERTGCAVWLFDFARLERPEAFEAVLALAPGAPAALLEDGRASEAAAWSEPEVRELLAESGLGDLAGGAERRIGHLQAYGSATSAAASPPWTGPPLGPASGAVMERIRAGLPALPDGV